MLLTYPDLIQLVEQHVIDAPTEHVNAASIDVRIGDKMLIENSHGHKWADLSNNETPPMRELELLNDRFTLYPGDFVLAQTIETFNLPDDIACEFKLRSSLARSGLEHSLAGWGDPGWTNATLTLELRNVLRHTIIQLAPGMRIGQVVFWRGAAVPRDRSYATRGRYNGQTTPQESKGHA
jgi:dCTP deaminase